VRLLIADDHPWVREGLRCAFSDTEVVIVAEADTGEGAVLNALQLDIDVLLIDLRLPDIDGIDVIMRIKSARPGLPILVYSANDRADVAERCATAGACGYLLKGVGRQSLVAAIRAASSGQEFWGPNGRGSAHRD